MGTYTITITDPVRIRALQAATDRANSDAAAAATEASVETPATITPDQFLSNAQGPILDQYVDTYLKRVINSADFVLRFTPQENDAITTSTDPNVVALLDKLKSHPTVDLTHSDTTMGVGYLQMIGLLSADRAAAILAF